MPRFLSRAAALLLLASMPRLLLAQTFPTGLGVYHWGGQYPHSIDEGVVAIAGLGGHVARIVLSPRYYLDYHIDSICYPSFSLATIAQEPDVRQALANPAIDVFMITAFDGITYGDCQTLNFLNPAFFTPDHFAQVAREYSDFTLYLEQTFRHTRKRFILSNWESDNSVFCGAAYSYATSAAIRNSCRAQYPSSFGIPSPEDALQGLKLWLQARSQGIQNGEFRARAAGYEDRRVFHAPEFNIVHALHDRGFPSVLYDVLPYVPFDYVSYSAWETLIAPNPFAALPVDLDTIRNVIGTSAIIVGEAGFQRLAGSTANVTQSGRFVAVAAEWGVPFLFQWQLYDSDPSHAYGLFDLYGQPTALAGWFQSRFQLDARSTPENPTPQDPRPQSGQ